MVSRTDENRDIEKLVELAEPESIEGGEEASEDAFKRLLERLSTQLNVLVGETPTSAPNRLVDSFKTQRIQVPTRDMEDADSETGDPMFQ